MKQIFRTLAWCFCLLTLAGQPDVTGGRGGACGTAWAAPIISSLQTDGRTIRDGAGQTILLKGLNVETHNWAYEAASYNAETKKWSIVNEAAVVSEMQQMNAWLLTQEDIQRMKEWGANVLRLQLSHYFFESIHTPGIYYDWAFTKLAEWLNIAAENGIYIIIDLHVPFGGRLPVEPKASRMCSLN